MKNILVVDDEIDLAESLASFLETSGYTADYCPSVGQATSKMSQKHYDLVISDITMPEVDGLTFYNSIKDDLKKKNMQFIFMTGYSGKVNLQTAYQMGVDEFVSKPFDLDDMKSVVNILLQGEQDQNYANEKFYKVVLEEFLQASVNQYDIFLKVNNNYLCLAKRGQELLPERLLNYHRKGMEHIYLNAHDFSSYIGMQVDISRVVNASSPIPKEKKLQLFNHFCKTLSESALTQLIDETLYNQAYDSFENYTQISIDNNDLFSLMNSLKDHNKDASTKSVLVSFLALVVFQHWSWTNPKHLSRISLSALLCDIGLKDMLELAKKDIIDMNSEEKKEYEKHPLQSYLILSKIKGIPSEILYVAAQHHENDVGLGFPHRLAKMKIHPYSRVIHALVEFVDKAERLDSKNSIKECLDTLLGFEQKLISLQILKTLYLVFDLPVPNELRKILLPTDTTRLT